MSLESDVVAVKTKFESLLSQFFSHGSSADWCFTSTEYSESLVQTESKLTKNYEGWCEVTLKKIDKTNDQHDHTVLYLHKFSFEATSLEPKLLVTIW